MLAWVKKRRRTIRREDLISFLCGKAPPHRSSRANPRLAMVAPSRANSPAETGSSVEADLQPFREAIALHGEDYLEYPGSIGYFFIWKFQFFFTLLNHKPLLYVYLAFPFSSFPHTVLHLCFLHAHTDQMLASPLLFLFLSWCLLCCHFTSIFKKTGLVL